MDIAEMPVEHIIDHLCQRCEWVAVVAKYGDNDLAVITVGANGLELLGGIELLRQSHAERCLEHYHGPSKFGPDIGWK